MKQQFLKELEVLLNKYNASIEFEVGHDSDLECVYDEKMTVNVDDQSVLNIPGWIIDAKNLKGK